MSETFSLLIVDDHAVLRAGLEALIRQIAPQMRLVGSLASGPDAVSCAQHHHPDVILADLSLDGLHGLPLIQALHQASPQSRIIVLSMYCDAETVMGALQAGARGYVRKSHSFDSVFEAIQSVLKGASYLGPEASGYVLDRMRHGAELPPARPQLTPRELEILRLLALGHRSHEIATRMGLSVQAIRSHRTGLRRKLGVQNTAGATRAAMEMGLLGTKALAAGGSS